MSYTLRAFLLTALLIAAAYAEDPWTPSPLCPFPSEELTRFPYEGDCSKYWECFEGARYPMDCPAGLEYNAEQFRCDTPSIANCDPDATIIYPTYPHSTQSTASTEPTADPGPAPDCPFPSEELIFFPVANNCSQYWECFQGNRYLMSCPTDLYWNVLANYCDFPANVDCSLNNVTTTPGSSTTPENSTTSVTTEPTSVDPDTTTPTSEPGTTVDNLCQDQQDGTFFSDPDDCSKFYECISGKITIGQCSEGLLWNQLAHTCDYPANVSC